MFWRSVCAGLGALCLGFAAEAQQTTVITAADLAEPTSRYAHGVLGDAIEWGALTLKTRTADGAGRTVTIRLPETRVFEDIEARLVTVENGAAPKVMVVESDLGQGARLSLYDETGLVAATPFIGRPNRWLAPIGAADLDGDGAIELAYVDRPHLAKTIRVWRFDGAKLVPVADLAGFTNHRIGEDTIAGGMRSCDGGAEMIVADAGWSRIYAIRFDGTGFLSTDLGPHKGRSSFAAALACEPVD